MEIQTITDADTEELYSRTRVISLTMNVLKLFKPKTRSDVNKEK